MRPFGAGLVLLAVMSFTGCDGCGPVGVGPDAVGVEIPVELFVSSGSVSFRVCDDSGCADSVQRLGRLHRQVVRVSSATFEDLGRSFDPGRVSFTVELRGAHAQLIARRQQDVELTVGHPNAGGCDDEAVVTGEVQLLPSDRV